MTNVAFSTLAETASVHSAGLADADYVQGAMMDEHSFSTLAETFNIGGTTIVATWEDDIVAQMAMAAITTSRTTIYTVPADHNAIIRDITMVNDSASLKTVDLWVNGFKLESSLNIPAHQGYTSPMTGVELAEGLIIEAQASAAGVNLFAWGVLEIAA